MPASNRHLSIEDTLLIRWLQTIPSLLFTSSVALALLSLSFCAFSQDIRVQLRWQHQFQFAGFYAALHKGFYQQAGLNVVLLEGGPSINPVMQVLAAKADFGVSNSSLIIDYMSGRDVVMLGPIFQHSPNILLADKAFASPIDLAREGRIALMGGDQDVELKAMFVSEGIDVSKVEFIEKQRHLQDLLEHKVSAINAYLSNEPFVLDEMGVAYQIIEPRRYGLDFYGDTLFTSGWLYKHRPDQVDAFRKATFEGWAYALAHPDEIIDLIVQHYNTQHKSRAHLAFEARILHELISPELVQIGHSNPGRWQHILSVYRRFDFATTQRDLDGFFYQEHREVDLTWLYLSLAVALLSVLVVGWIAYYIHSVNRQLRKSHLRYKLLFQNSASAGIVWTQGYIITGWNEQAARLFGWSADEVIGRSFFEFLVPKDEAERVEQNLATMRSNNPLNVFVNQNLTRDGRVLCCEWFNTALPQMTDSGTFEVVSLAIDISQRVEQEKQLQHKAHYDPLTHLPNRHYFETLLQEAPRLAARDQQTIGLAFIDLDGFKAVNDTYGHDAGDRVLRVVAQRITHLIQQNDKLVRLGGDEFALIFYRPSRAALDIPFFERLLAQVSQVIDYQQSQLQVSVSIGISLYHADSALSLNEVLLQADVAMYQAKKSGKNRYCVYDGESSYS
ncbi:MAG: diguanylate cyclase [Thiomicrospira sp.]|jgi:diguanylate cyclase (GGDEF)-like protein/PAS domain S-box-containing protein